MTTEYLRKKPTIYLIMILIGVNENLPNAHGMSINPKESGQP